MIPNVQIAYDKIAASYDSEGVALETPNFIKTIIPHVTGKVLDVGSGKGLAIQAFSIEPQNYTGIEPNSEMAKIFTDKYPNYAITKASFEETDFSSYDTLIALHGVGSYIHPDHYERLANNNKYIIMFYKDDSYPWYYGPQTCQQIKENVNWQKIRSVFKDVFDSMYYTIATNIPGLREELTVTSVDLP